MYNDAMKDFKNNTNLKQLNDQNLNRIDSIFHKDKLSNEELSDSRISDAESSRLSKNIDYKNEKLQKKDLGN